MGLTKKINNSDIGIPANKLKMLSADQEFLNSDQFFQYTPLNKTDIAKKAGLNRKTLYSSKIKLSTLKEIKMGIIQVVIGTDLAIDLFDNNTKEAVDWFQKPNTLLFGESPFEVCIRAEGKFLINWLMNRLGKSGVTES